MEHTCEHCANYQEPGERRRYSWHEVVPALCMAVSLIGGGVWFFGAQASAIADEERRVLALEKFRDNSVDKLTEILGRVIRIETMVEKDKK